MNSAVDNGERHIMRWCFQGFNSKTASSCGKSSENLSNAQEPWYHRHFQSETWKWRNTISFQSSSWLTPILLCYWSQKRGAITIAMGTSSFLIGIQASSWNILFRSLIAAHDLLLLAWARGPGEIPGSQDVPNAHSGSGFSPLPGREQDTLFHGSVLSQWNKDDSVKQFLVNVSS